MTLNSFKNMNLFASISAYFEMFSSLLAESSPLEISSPQSPETSASGNFSSNELKIFSVLEESAIDAKLPIASWDEQDNGSLKRNNNIELLKK